MTRTQRFAGLFYPKEKNEIIQKIENCFLHKLGPGSLPKKMVQKEKISAVIVPHAGYDYSGPCASHAYKLLAETKTPKTYIIIGPSHRTYESEICIEDHQTPLGVIKTNKELAQKISQTLNIKTGNQQLEHSIEVQLPFLQYIKKDENIQIITVMLAQDLNAKQIGAFKEITKNGDITYIISSDFTHHGENFDYTPFTKDIQKNIHSLDQGAINNILKQDAEGFIDYLKKTQATICGYTPIIFLLKTLKKTETKLIKYYTSTEITNDKNNSVSYASISFK